MNDAEIKLLMAECQGFLELELYDRALDRAASLLAARQEAAFAHSVRGEAFMYSARYQEGEAEFLAAREISPDLDTVYLGLGYCYKRMGRLDLAIKALEELRTRKPKLAIAEFNLACYLALNGQAGLALMHLREAIARSQSYRKLAHEDSDFDPIRNDPAFIALVGLPEELPE